MADVGYIKGIRIVEDITGRTTVHCERLRITLKGLEYLQEDSIDVIYKKRVFDYKER